MKRLVAIALLASAVPCSAGDFSSGARGTATVPFLRLGGGARTAAMGDTQAAVADDATALFLNPASLTRVKKNSISLTHAPYLESTAYQNGAYAHNMGRFGALAVGAQFFSAGDIKELDAGGTEVGTINPNDAAFSIGYAVPIHGYSIGVAGKFIRSEIVDTAQTGAADVGVLSPELFDTPLRVGIAATNIGGQLRFDQEDEDLPLTIRAGAAARLGSRWTLAVDGVFPKSDAASAAAGAEYKFMAGDGLNVRARVGYNSATAGDVDGFTGATCGLGVGLGRFVIDYGFIPLGTVGLTHRISITAGF